MRVMAIDYGDARTGIAVSDAAGLLAGYTTVIQGRDPDPIRQGILRREDETEEAYAAFLREDCRRQNELLRPILGGDVDILAYPYGAHETLSEILLQEAGIYATVTISPGINTIVKGIPQSLLCMNRFNIDESMTGEGLLALLENSPP